MTIRIGPANSTQTLSKKTSACICLENCEGKKCNEKALVSFESAFENVGDFGRYQKCVIFIFFLMCVAVGKQVMITYFVALDPTWMCEMNSSICTIHNITFANTNNSRCGMSRSDWTYTEPFAYSVITQFDLSCSRQWFRHLINSAFFVGWAFGALLLGSIADNHGRKTVVYPAVATMLIVTTISAFSPNVYLFIVSRLVVGIAIPGTFVQLAIHVTELVGSNRRALSAQIILAGFTLGYTLLGIIAYFVQEWKYILLYSSLPYLPLVASFKFVSESLSWLRTKDKTNDLINSLKQIAYWNRKSFTRDIRIRKPVDTGDNNTSKITDIFRTKKVFVSSMVQGFAWFSNAIVYFGLYFAANDLGGSAYRDFIILSIADLPGNIVTAILMDRLGRRRTIIATMVISGVSCLSIGFIASNREVKVLKIVIGTLGKIVSLIAFDGFYTWSSEIYPTEVRSIGNGFTQFACRVGAASAPWIGNGMKFVSPGAPYFVMGVLVIISAFFCVLLPETKTRNTNECVDTEGDNNNNG